MQKQVAIVTGASAGIGKGVAIKLVKKGINVVLLNRDSPKARQVLAELQAIAANVVVELIPADLSSKQSIQNFVQIFQKKYTKVDYIFACAGVLLTKREESVDGLEKMFATNYLGHFLLLNLLFEQLSKSEKAKVVVVSGRGHKSTWLEGRKGATVDFEDLQGTQQFSFIKAAKQAVLCRILLTYALSKRWKDTNIEVCTVCPGLVKTSLTRHFSFPLNLLAKFNFWIRSAQTIEGAGKNLYQLTLLENIHGKYFEVSNKTKKIAEAKSAELSYNEPVANQLWASSEQLLGQEFDY